METIDNFSPKRNDNALVHAAISLFGNRVSGPEPQWHELAAWREGSLPDERARQVLSYVANNPDSFQQWLDMVEAEQWVEEESLNSAATLDTTAASAAVTVDEVNSEARQNHSAARRPSDGRQSSRDPAHSIFSASVEWFRSFFQQPMAVYGGAFAAIMLAVLVVPLMQRSNLSAMQQEIDRSLDTYIESGAGLPATVPTGRTTRGLSGLFEDLTVLDVEKRYFGLGLQQSAEALGAHSLPQWQQWIDDQGSEPVDCSKALDQEHCTLVAPDFTALGRWTMTVFAACSQASATNPVSADFWSAQDDLYSQLRSLDSISESQLFSPAFDTLQRQATPDTSSTAPGTASMALCATVNNLIATGL